MSQSAHSIENSWLGTGDSRSRQVIEAAPCGMIMSDKNGKIVLVNSLLESMFGYQRQELLGQDIDLLVPKSIKDKYTDYKKSFFANPQAKSMGEGRDLYGLRKDGSTIPIDIGLNPLVIDDQIFVLASVVDISTGKLIEEALKQNILELERSNYELQQFAYICSHDLQEPLRSISNFTQLLAQRYEKQLDDQGKQFIEFTINATKRMQALINDLLLFSRVQTRGQEFQETDCAKILSQAIANLTTAIEESHAQILYGSLPIVRVDSSQLLQLFQNLLSNAIKFRSKAPPQISLLVEDKGHEWLFTVKDNGVGLDMKHGDRIFVIFQRLHNQETYPGNGIGLAVCRKIVERHGGRIWVESELNVGTAIYFTLPKSTSGASNHEISS